MVLKDIKGGPSADIKRALRDLGRDPERGKKLGGKLSGCRSHRVGQDRVVYRTVETGDDEVTVEVIAIDRRRDKEVYESAATRL